MDMGNFKIISISRRGDIPAFHTPWLIKRLQEGFCHIQMPYGAKVLQVSLRPEDCAGIVFWTRNPLPLFNYLDELKNSGYFFYFHFTITGYPRPVESNTPSLLKSIDRFKFLSKQIGSNGVHWRYDPILLSSITPETFHINNFSFIAKKLKGHTKICTISFTQFYEKSQNNFKKLNKKYGIRFDEVSQEQKTKLSQTLKEIASENEIEIKSCCDNSLFSAGIQKGSCIGPEYLSLVRPDFFKDWKKKPTRKECECFESIDIGAYETCVFGCSYCYATRNRETALRHLKDHNKDDTIIIRPKKYRGIELPFINPTEWDYTGHD